MEGTDPTPIRRARSSGLQRRQRSGARNDAPCAAQCGANRREARRVRDRFSLGPEAFKPAKSSAPERLDALERTIGGPLPFSIRCWWEQIEFVHLGGQHEILALRGDPDG